MRRYHRGIHATRPNQHGISIMTLYDTLSGPTQMYRSHYWLKAYIGWPACMRPINATIAMINVHGVGAGHPGAWPSCCSQM